MSRTDRAVSATMASSRSNGSLRAFTLIELLVVVAIIDLLISVLLPSLKTAREQAKTVTCVANLKQIGNAAVAYLENEKDRFPFGWDARPGNPRIQGARTWAFGGKRGRGGGDLWWYERADYYPSERALNRYVYNTTKFNHYADLAVYKCPSDGGIRLNADPASPPSQQTGYDGLGTSYQSNSSWRYYADAAGGTTPGEGYSGTELTKRVNFLSNNIIRIMRRHTPSRYIIVYEDPADWALNTSDSFPVNYKVVGWHGKADFHSAGFLDGHAENLPIDHRKNSRTIAKNSGTSRWVARQDYREE